jgi:DNA modification methylase
VTALILRGDAACLPLPDESVDLIATSPPYFGLRSYTDGGRHYDGQIGSEATPREYIAALLGCTREWMRVLKPGGSIFVNLGDKYSTYTGANWGNGRSLDGLRGTAKVPHGGPVNAPRAYGIPCKSLMGLPWRYAIGCIDQLDLILRAEIIWDKPSAMPESVTDRVKRSHEQVFHFTKSGRYFAATDEIRQPLAAPGRKAGATAFGARDASLPRSATGAYGGQNPLGALLGSVWEIAPSPLSVPPELGVSHFAAFPLELCRRIVLGWSPAGICTECGEGRRPVAAGESEIGTRASDMARKQGSSWKPDGATPKRTLGPRSEDRNRRITGYACACPDTSAPIRPAVVADPFGGTGTTALVADVLGRTGVTVDRSADYCRIAQWRTADPAERARAACVPKPPPVIDGQRSLFDGLEAS